VGRDLTDIHAEVGSVFHLVGERRAGQQRLGGNEAPEDAGPAESIAFDDEGGEAELAAADCAYVTRRTAADEDDVVRSHLNSDCRVQYAERLNLSLGSAQGYPA